jgi:hypothetical protein
VLRPDKARDYAVNYFGYIHGRFAVS